MKNKNYYMVATVEENKKYYSYVIIYHNYNNLLSTLKEHKNLLHVNICNTKKEARSLVDLWNDSYQKNGTYLFDGDLPF